MEGSAFFSSRVTLRHLSGNELRGDAGLEGNGRVSLATGLERGSAAVVGEADVELVTGSFNGNLEDFVGAAELPKIPARE